ncbi:hypothetical protein IC235_01605 [Hymenobacter sp. BT664]|uniref:Uncharacterized protein n=2 Tax=Hymenobacter montanus TaxID=2771359 RepID=A0A927GHR2_9BACT|nr:hypothetical protein [Hymenobacter montanus]
MNYDALFSNSSAPQPKSSLGGVQHDIFFSVMKIIHRQSQPVPPPPSDKVARLSCCCRISELMPLVRQLHDEARAQAQAQAQASSDAQQAA